VVLCPTNNEQCPYRVRCCFAAGQRGQANYGRVARGLTDLLPGSGGSSVLIGGVCSHLSSGHSIDLIHLSEAAIATPSATAADQPSVAEGAEAQDFEREVAKLTALSLVDLSARLGAAATADTAPAVSVTLTQCFKRDPLVRRLCQGARRLPVRGAGLRPPSVRGPGRPAIQRGPPHRAAGRGRRRHARQRREPLARRTTARRTMGRRPGRSGPRWPDGGG